MKSEREEARSRLAAHTCSHAAGGGGLGVSSVRLLRDSPPSFPPSWAALPLSLSKASRRPGASARPDRDRVKTSTMAGSVSPGGRAYTEEQEYLQAYEDVLEKYKGRVKCCVQAHLKEKDSWAAVLVVCWGLQRNRRRNRVPGTCSLLYGAAKGKRAEKR